MKASALVALGLGLLGSIHMACSSQDGVKTSTGAPQDSGDTSGDFTSSSGDPSGSSGDPSGSTGDPPSGSSGDPTGSSSTSGSTSSSSSSGGSDCAQMGTYDACDECECAKNSAGCDALELLYDDACLCGAMAPCAASCTAYCDGTNDDDAACFACDDMNRDETCWDAAAAACESDPDCKAYLDASTASCDALP